MLLTEALLRGINAEAASKMPDYKNKKLSAKAKKIIMGHGWPGNVRELQACLTRASVWAVGESITEREMREALLIRPAKSGDLLGMELDNTFDIQDVIKELKRHYIQKAMAEKREEQDPGSRKLGLKSYQVLNKWMEDIGLKE